ncbi:hypothetical protein, partial [Xanthomonas perforans]|uniref:hypothetical protein n=1 Tax=Xanthomonas perforans TaxID=442694 RepID=UPI001E49A2DA
MKWMRRTLVHASPRRKGTAGAPISCRCSTFKVTRSGAIGDDAQRRPMATLIGFGSERRRLA